MHPSPPYRSTEAEQAHTAVLPWPARTWLVLWPCWPAGITRPIPPTFSTCITRSLDAGNLNYTDDSGDGIKEPLLDVSNSTLFNPVLIPGGGGGGPNQPPTADFTYTTSGLTANFTSTSSDLDGIIVSWNWNFGAKPGSTAQNPSRTFPASGTYSVRLTVTDDDGATASVTKSVTVSSGGGSGITLSVTAYRVTSAKYADLVWSGATSVNVDVYRNGSRITTTANDGAYTDGPVGKLTSATYKVCQAGTSVCSNSVTVSW